MMSRASITPKVAEWARERRGFSHALVADKLGTKLSNVRSWETGDAKPTMRQARRLAKVLHIPFGYLFLSKPPAEETPLPDFRTVAGRTPEALSPDFRDVLNDAFVKQDWYRSFLREEGATKLEIVARYTLEDDPEDVATYLRVLLAIESIAREASTYEDFLRQLIRQTERAGVITMRSGVVRGNNYRPLSVDEFRGFAVSDEVAPLIFINGQDTKAAQIFTLVHELTHIAIGSSGISNPYLGNPVVSSGTEQFCNQVAAETLLPTKDLELQWDSKRDLEVNVKKLSRLHKVSSLVVLRRARDARKLGRQEFKELYSRTEQAVKGREAPTGDGGDFYNTLPARNSNTLTRAIVSAAFNGRLPYRDAARFLAVKIETLPKVAEKLGMHG